MMYAVVRFRIVCWNSCHCSNRNDCSMKQKNLCKFSESLRKYKEAVYSVGVECFSQTFTRFAKKFSQIRKEVN